MQDDFNTDDGGDLNFWPAFADMMLVLVILLVSVLVVIAAVSAAGTVDLRETQRKQAALIAALATEWRAAYQDYQADEALELIAWLHIAGHRYTR